MNTKKTNLSEYDAMQIPDASEMSFGIVVAEWNPEITKSLLDGAIDTFKKHNVSTDNIYVKYVPGSFELPLGASWMLAHHDMDAILCLGCIIQGETRHFDFIAQGVTRGIMQLNMAFARPVIFGVLTTDNQEQALDRAGGKHGNKGVEAALTAIKMVALGSDISSDI